MQTFASLPFFTHRCLHTFLVVLLAAASALAANSAHPQADISAASKECQAINDPDVNQDGSVDFCDVVLLDHLIASFFGGGPGDLNADEVTDSTDLYVLLGCLCGGLSQPVAPSTATIGVYFDDLGQVTRLCNVVPGTLVDMYVVARDVISVDGIGGFTFQIDCPPPNAIVGVEPPAGFSRFNLSTDMATCMFGSYDGCLPPACTVLLLHFTLLYAGGTDVPVMLTGADHCAAPTAGPAFVSCNSSSEPCSWTYFDPGEIGSAVINSSTLCECPTYSDINEDGVVGFCDEVIIGDFYNYQQSSHGHPRGDLNGDGFVDPDDLIQLKSDYNAPVPLTTPSSATVGLFFDTVGTITELRNVGISQVDFYAVAHDVDDSNGIGGFAFDVRCSNPSAIWGIVELPYWTGCARQPDPWGYQIIGSRRECLGPASSIKLMGFSVFYLGEPNLTFSLHPAPTRDIPPDHPAYVNCNSSCTPCTWHYFGDSPPPLSIVINPTDINGDNVDDIRESECTRSYEIEGTSNGTSFQIGLRFPGTGAETYSGPLIVSENDNAHAFALKFVEWLDGLGGFAVPHAEITGTGSGFSVTCPETYQNSCDFQLGVSTDGGWCWVDQGTVCTFNPTLREVGGSTAVPSSTSFAVGNHPNPFNACTTIKFDLPADSSVTLRIYDSAGRLIRILIGGSHFSAGRHDVVWDCRDAAGGTVGAGVYIYRLEAEGCRKSGRMVFVK